MVCSFSVWVQKEKKTKTRKKGKKMKKTVLLALGVVLVSSTAFALSITGSKHDLSTTTAPTGGITSGTIKLCEVCHAPHNAAQNIPLWNRTNPAGASITTYHTSSTLSTATKNTAVLPTGSISLHCMSCHASSNGTAANVSVMKTSSLNADVLAATWTGTITNGGFSTDLSNDHPVGIDYVAAYNGRVSQGGTALQPLATATGSGAVFFTNGTLTNQMECASCHKVHDRAIDPFLRVTNAGSALCKACHTN